MQMRYSPWPGRRAAYACGALLFAAGLPAALGVGQNSISNSTKRDTLLLPAANHLPDVNDQMLLSQQKQRKQNFDAVNALRRKQIDDDAQKVLILANDLKEKLRLLEGKPVPDQLLREAAVIELLAHDIQTRMTVIVSRD
jgi:hypothetical protein